ncbi:Yae1 family protein [Fretibacterium fastidiosum]|uniref:Essential protein Yae1, N terminal n=1 Tax=Fretibacterium fastidiosum TaxID=651822 RepID=A0AB94IW79_9BACT|nr:Yae1 family protein [Fretibacterium fastidiosum]CBL28007.1 Essential protein Yae1, N terminal [Fretibacterium fastidiosum]
MTNDETGVSIVQTTADTVFQRVNDTEKEYWSSFAVRYRQLQEQIAEWDRRAFLKDARNQGLAEGHKQGLEEGRKEGLEQGLERGRALGEAKGRADVVRQLAASGLLTLEQVAQATGMSTEEVKAITSE